MLNESSMDIKECLGTQKITLYKYVLDLQTGLVFHILGCSKEINNFVFICNYSYSAIRKYRLRYIISVELSPLKFFKLTSS